MFQTNALLSKSDFKKKMFLHLHWLPYLFHSLFANKSQNQNKGTGSIRSSKKYHIPGEKAYVSLKSYDYKGTNLFSFHYDNAYADTLGFAFVSAWPTPLTKMCSWCSDKLNFKTLLCRPYLFTSCGHEPQFLGSCTSGLQIPKGCLKGWWWEVKVFPCLPLCQMYTQMRR